MDKTNYRSLKDAASEFDTSKVNLYSLHNSGKITLKKLGGRTYVDVKELESCMTDMPRKK